MKRREGFTLIELLVVIAIIALLVSILLPSLKNAKELAKTVRCKANEHSVGVTCALYANDLGDLMPYYVTSAPEGGLPLAFPTGWYKSTWFRAVPGYLGQNPDAYHWARPQPVTILQCPKETVGGYGINISQNVNAGNTRQIAGGFAYDGIKYKMADVRKPGQKAMFIDSETIVYYWYQGTKAQSYFERYARFRHNNSDTLNAVMVDGHAESFTYNQLINWNDIPAMEAKMKYYFDYGS